MSRYREGDDDWWEPEAILAQGRWGHNYRQALKGKRGRKALRDLREALLALPEKRLISGAMCTFASVDEAFPVITAEDIAQEAAKAAAWREAEGLPPESAEDLAWRAEDMRETREDQREEYSELVAAQGCGVCAIAALLWHRKVADGTDPAAAFSSLPPLVGDEEVSDPLGATADIAAAEAGLARTLAWELAYRNDETYELKTPEERYTAFLEWIDAELAAEGASS